MKVRLYGYTVTLIEEQIYEGKAKYITSEESFNTTIDLRNYFKTNSIKNLKNNLPRYVGNILMKVSQKFADKLNSEGIYSATAKSYLDSVYTPAGRGLTSQFQTAFQRVFANNPQRLSSDEIEYLISGANNDVFQLYSTYVMAHNKTITRYYGDDKKNQAFAIFDNIADGKVPPDKVERAVVDALVMCPYYSFMYSMAFNYLGDGNGTLYEYAKVFDVDIDIIKKGSYTNEESEKNAVSYFGKDYPNIRIKYANNDYFNPLKSILLTSDLIQMTKLMNKQFSERTNDVGYLYCVDVGYKFNSKAENVQETYAQIPPNEFIIMVYDNTIIGYAKDGFTITDKNFYYKGGNIPLDNLTEIGLGPLEPEDFGTFKVGNVTIRGGQHVSIVKEVIELINAFLIVRKYAPRKSNGNVIYDKSGKYDKNLNVATKKSAPSRSTPQNTSSNSNRKRGVMTDADVDEFIQAMENLRQQHPEYNFKSHIYHVAESYIKKSDKVTKKFRGAIGSYARLQKGETPLVCYDATVFGGAEDGMLVTSFGVHIHNNFEDAVFISFENLKSIVLKGVFNKDLYINDKKIETVGLDNDSRQAFKEVIEFIHNYFMD